MKKLPQVIPERGEASGASNGRGSERITDDVL
jgi:hypothetical protein